VDPGEATIPSDEATIPSDEAASDPAARAAFLAHRRQVTTERYDTRFAASYDAEWGAIAPSHAAMLQHQLDATRSGGLVLDAACGTGKYWPAILASGRHIQGVDQSAGMLERAARKLPAVRTRRLSLQDLDEHERYDAVICVDALENVGPEDWPAVVGHLRDAARPGAPIWLTVELFDPLDQEAGRLGLAEALAVARARGEPVVAGEHLNADGGYHYYPGLDRVLTWLDAAGIAVVDTLEADGYLHVLGRRPG
jgi:SAM-dependent methyltransferase